MAFNRPAKGGHPNMSVSLETFWSTDPYALGNGDFQNIKLGVYGNKLTLNFQKGNTKEGQKSKSAFLSMDYESAIIVARTLTYIENTRKDCVKHGVEYPIWSFKNTIQFTDKESKTLRTIGVFEIKTEISPVTQKNTVYVSYTQGPDKFEVALGSMYLKDQCEYSDRPDFDTNDSRFYAFNDLFRSILVGWPMIQTQQKILGITMNNFGAIRTKLGIPVRPEGKGGDGGAGFTDSNYHSSGSSDSGTDFDGPAPDVSDGPSDMPF